MVIYPGSGYKGTHGQNNDICALIWKSNACIKIWRQGWKAIPWKENVCWKTQEKRIHGVCSCLLEDRKSCGTGRQHLCYIVRFCRTLECFCLLPRVMGSHCHDVMGWKRTLSSLHLEKDVVGYFAIRGQAIFTSLPPRPPFSCLWGQGAGSRH